MPMSSFGTMQARIADELMRTDLQAQIRGSILTAIAHYDRERFWFNEGLAEFATTAGQPDYGSLDGLPADLAAIDMVAHSEPGRLRRLVPGDFQAVRLAAGQGQGRPLEWALYAGRLWLGPTPDAVYTLQLTYVRRLPAPFADSDGSAWFSEGEALIRSRAKAELAMHVLRDPDLLRDMIGAAEDAFLGLRRDSLRRVATGRLVPGAVL